MDALFELTQGNTGVIDFSAVLKPIGFDTSFVYRFKKDQDNNDIRTATRSDNYGGGTVKLSWDKKKNELNMEFTNLAVRDLEEHVSGFFGWLDANGDTQQINYREAIPNSSNFNTESSADTFFEGIVKDSRRLGE